MLRSLENCNVSHPVEFILSWCIAGLGILTLIGFTLMIIGAIRNEYF